MVTRSWSREYGCSRLFSARYESTGVLGFQFRSSWDSGVLGLTPACRARAFSALPPLIIRIGRSRPYFCLQSSGVLGSASAHHKARAFSVLPPLVLSKDTRPVRKLRIATTNPKTASANTDTALRPRRASGQPHNVAAERDVTHSRARRP